MILEHLHLPVAITKLTTQNHKPRLTTNHNPNGLATTHGSPLMATAPPISTNLPGEASPIMASSRSSTASFTEAENVEVKAGSHKPNGFRLGVSRHKGLALRYTYRVTTRLMV